MQCRGHELIVKVHYTFKNNFLPNIFFYIKTALDGPNMTLRKNTL